VTPQLHTHKFAEEQVLTSPRETAERRDALMAVTPKPSIDELLSAFKGAHLRIVGEERE
jgi:hypothetical protein